MFNSKKLMDLSSPTGGQGAFPTGGQGAGLRIFLIGFMGCGKTHWGKLLGEKFSIPFFDLDIEIETKEGKTVNEIFEEEGEEHFRVMEKDMLHHISEENERFVIACGGGTPCFYNNIEYMKKKGTTVWIHCSIDCLYKRLIREKNNRPLLKDLSDKQLKSYIIKKFSDRKIYYEQSSVIVNKDVITFELLVDKIFHN
ncbi:MAG: shikimate kinase [Chitinophagaceae bacterium]